jgi:hypothetical protein
MMYEVTLGQKVPGPEFERLLQDGVIRRVFSRGPRCCVPLLWNPQLHVKQGLWALFNVTRGDFHADGTQKLVGGKYRYGKHNLSTLRKAFSNFGKRLENCNLSDIPWDVIPEFHEHVRGGGKMNLTTYVHGTNDNETHHSALVATGGATNVTVESKHAHGMMAITSISRKGAEKRGEFSIGHNDFQINLEANEHAATSGVMTVLRDVPKLAPVEVAADNSKFILRNIDRPLQPVGSKVARRMMNPMKVPERGGRKLSTGLTSPIATSTGVKGPQSTSPPRKRPAETPVGSTKRQKVSSSKADFNRFPCTCGNASMHSLQCSRKTNMAAIERAIDSGLPYHHSDVPKPQPGDVLVYLASASKVGALCFPRAGARSNQWVPIGTQCMNCHKFDKEKAHRGNISSLKTKYGVTIEACDCIV